MTHLVGEKNLQYDKQMLKQMGADHVKIQDDDHFFKSSSQSLLKLHRDAVGENEKKSHK